MTTCSRESSVLLAYPAVPQSRSLSGDGCVAITDHDACLSSRDGGDLAEQHGEHLELCRAVGVAVSADCL